MTIYLVWAYDQYYPMGPRDLKGVFQNEEDAQACLDEIVDRGGYDHQEITTKEVE